MPVCAANCLNGEIFYSLREAQIIIESWRHHYNTIAVLKDDEAIDRIAPLRPFSIDLFDASGLFILLSSLLGAGYRFYQRATSGIRRKPASRSS
jgi:hypothetical protein